MKGLLPSPCTLMTRPVRWMPPGLHSVGLASALNQVFATPLAQGEMEFLHGRTLRLTVTDIGFRGSLRYAGGRFEAAPADVAADLSFSGDLHTFLLLATQREDADSLFFRRRLRIEGDTATSLHLKNFIDALEQPPLPQPLQRALQGFTDLYSRHCSGESQAAQPFQASPATPRQ